MLGNVSIEHIFMNEMNIFCQDFFSPSLAKPCGNGPELEKCIYIKINLLVKWIGRQSNLFSNLLNSGCVTEILHHLNHCCALVLKKLRLKKKTFCKEVGDVRGNVQNAVLPTYKHLNWVMQTKSTDSILKKKNWLKTLHPFSMHVFLFFRFVR